MSNWIEIFLLVGVICRSSTHRTVQLIEPREISTFEHLIIKILTFKSNALNYLYRALVICKLVLLNEISSSDRSKAHKSTLKFQIITNVCTYRFAIFLSWWHFAYTYSRWQNISNFTLIVGILYELNVEYWSLLPLVNFMVIKCSL